LERVGLTDDYIANKIKSLTKAKRTQVLRDRGETKVIKHEDNTTQLQATRLASQLKDLFPSEKIDVKQTQDRSIQITISEDETLKKANKPIDGEIVDEITTLIPDENKPAN